jgi:hypothetical protein
MKGFYHSAIVSLTYILSEGDDFKIRAYKSTILFFTTLSKGEGRVRPKKIPFVLTKRI